MPDLICNNSKGCDGLTEGQLYKVVIRGDYAYYNGTRYLASRFESFHKPIPADKYYEIIGIGSVSRDELNDLNTAINLERGIDTYETANIQTCISKSQVPVLRQSSDSKHSTRKHDKLFMRLLSNLFNKGSE